MACRFEYDGKTYDQDGLAKALENMSPSEASKYIPGVKNVPDAPFKKTWHELALKRMLREAAEKGYDRLSWTPGEAQAARYDLSKQVDAVKASRNPDGTFQLSMKMPGREMQPSSEHNAVPANKLSDVVGKELAEKIVKDASEGSKNWGVKNKASNNWSQRFASKEEAEKYQNSLPESIRGKTEVLEMVPKTSKEYSGVDLKVGGEGMKGFYDKMIPQALEKIGKEHGVKVQKGEVAANAEGSLPAGATGRKLPVHYIDIPQSLKDRAMQKGFPLFSGGYVYTPVDGDPFKDKK